MTVSAATRYHDRLKKKRQAIHVQRRQLGMEDDAYRALLQRVAGVKSSADLMTQEAADAVLDEMKRFGILPETFDLTKDTLDPFATDQAYWRSLWPHP